MQLFQLTDTATRSMLHSDQKSFTDIPLDIVLLIAELLDDADLKQCTFVSTVWSATFRPLLYRTAKIQHYEGFCTFYRTIEQSTKKPKRNGKSGAPLMLDLGRRVRTLLMRDGFLSVKRIQQLAVLCPNVSSVYFDWDEKGGILNTTPNARVFESPVPFFQHFHPTSLRSLTLGSWNMARDCRKTPDNFVFKVLIPVLQHLPQLESLTIDRDTYFMYIASMESIHEICCPRLKELSLVKKNIKSMYDFTATMATIKNVKPATTMESLSIADCLVWTDPGVLEGPWFTYITHKYPALRRLDISWRESQYNSLETLQYTPRGSQTIAFRDYFPQLEELVIGLFAGQRTTTWPRLVQGIPKVILRDDPTSSFSEWISSEATASLMQLSLMRIPDDLHELRHCSQLQELKLDSGTGHWLTGIVHNNLFDINLNVILSSCSALRKLNISRGNIYCSSSTSAEGTKSSLKSLVLHASVITSNAVLEHVGHWCPALIHLGIDDCMWILPDKNPIIRIDLPQHSLSYSRLVDLQVYRPKHSSDRNSLAPNRYLMVKTSNCDEDSSPLFHTGHVPSYPRKPFVRRTQIPAIVRWLNANADDDSYDSVDYNTIRKEAMEAIEDLRNHDIRNANGDTAKMYSEYAAEYNDASCAVLRCHGADRLYYGNSFKYSRLYLDAHNS